MTSLSWRIPTQGDPHLLRLSMVQIGLASFVAALILLVAAPQGWLVPGILGLIPVAIFMAYRRWAAYQRLLGGEHNVRIDEAGVHWIDHSGNDQLFPRRDVRGFRIGREAETMRSVECLTLHLTGGFETQPMELHEPATPDTVRERLAELGIQESTAVGSRPGDYDAAVAVYSECHDDTNEWHWEGTQRELARLFAIFAAAADELALPPPGAKPLYKTVVLQRRESSRLRIGHAPYCHFEHEAIVGTTAVLHAASQQAAAALATSSAPSDRKFDIPLPIGHVWTFHLHVMDA